MESAWLACDMRTTHTGHCLAQRNNGPSEHSFLHVSHFPVQELYNKAISSCDTTHACIYS